MLNVVCFYWRGKERPTWGGDVTLGMDYVNRLCRGVRRNLTLPHRFICLTNVPALWQSSLDPEVESMWFDAPSWRGCLPKLKAFDPALGLEGRVVVMDIDIVVTGSLDEMFGYDGHFMTRSTFVGPKLSGGDIVFFRAGGGMDWIWRMLTEDPDGLERRTGGRERYVYREFLHKNMDFVQDLYPGQLLSYKRHVRRYRDKLPENCRLVSCHGRPRPHELSDVPWMQKHWR